MLVGDALNFEVKLTFESDPFNTIDEIPTVIFDPETTNLNYNSELISDCSLADYESAIKCSISLSEDYDWSR